MKSTLKKYLLYATYTLLASGLLYGLLQLILSGYNVPWTGFQTKTLWDWMELLIIPIVLALGAFLLNRSEQTIERENANKRAELEREIAKDRQQEAALQSYIERMSGLLLEKKLRTTKTKEIRDVARTLTISVMRILGKERNNLVVQFLREAQLATDKRSILNGANLEGVNLQELDFRYIYLQNANLTKANLQGASFFCANLQEASFWQANLQGADFGNAVLVETYLAEANLREAKLNACLQGANLENADLQKAFFHGADLKEANLTFAKLIDADLFQADLQGADLAGADLHNANLTAASLEGAEVYEDQLKAAAHLDSLILPDGTILFEPGDIAKWGNR